MAWPIKMAFRSQTSETISPRILDWKDSPNWIRRWLFRLIARPSRALLLRAIIMLAIAACIDTITGLQLSVFAFYFVPIFISSFLVSPRAGVFTSLLASGLRALANYYYQGPNGDWVVAGWNFTVDSCSFLVFAFLLASVREQLDSEIDLGRRDSLTRAFNRRAFIEQVQNEIGRLRRTGPAFTLIYMDLDNFKALNDSEGHEAGDALLRDVANTLIKELRSIDIVARLGGDEFAVLMPQTGMTGAAVVLERVQSALRSTVHGRQCPVTFSIGCISYEVAPESFDAALREADALMYSAKKGGKDRLFHESRNGSTVGSSNFNSIAELTTPMAPVTPPQPETMTPVKPG